MSEVRAAPFNPFRVSRSKGPLERGQRISFLLGPEGLPAPGRRVVQGHVRSFAVRAAVIELHMDRISTWVYGDDDSVYMLPSGFRSMFEVGIKKTVEYTLDVLKNGGEYGRTELAAAEIPFKTCWSCRSDSTGKAFCSNCGNMQLVGEAEERTLAPPAPGSSSVCPACWGAVKSSDRYCPSCGYTPSLRGQVEGLRGTRRTFVFTVARERQGRVEATVRDASIRRIYRKGRSQILLTLESVVVSHTGEELDGVGLVVVMDADPHLVLEAVARLQNGDEMRVAEVSRRCPVCPESEDGEKGPVVMGAYCPECGERVRAFSHPHWGERMGRKSLVERHHCGGTCRPGLDAFCSYCGDSLSEGGGGGGRFAVLG